MESLCAEWLSIEQNDANADQVLYRLAEVQMKLANDRDADFWPRKAEKNLKNLLQQFPKSPLFPQAESDLYKMQETLADRDLGVARFYWTNRGAFAGAEDRLNEILEKYEHYSKTDEVLLMLGRIELTQENFEQGAIYLRLLVEKYPGNKYKESACDHLSSLGGQLPDACKF